MSVSPYSVKLGEIIKEFDLEVLRSAPDYENLPLRTVDVNRPGLPLAGFFEHFDTKRLLLIGLTENTYLAGMEPPAAGSASTVCWPIPSPPLSSPVVWRPFLSVWRWRKSTAVRCCAPRPRLRRL